jgi:hypothetical protein
VLGYVQPKEEIMSTLKDFTAAVRAFNQRFERVGPQAAPQDVFSLEGQLRVGLSKVIVESQGFDSKARWHEVNNLPGETVLTPVAEEMLQNYLELIRMNFGVRAGAMETFREVQQVYGGLQGYPLAESLPSSVKTEADMTFRALCVQLATDNGKDVVEIQNNFPYLPEHLVLSSTAKMLADRYFTLVETIFSPSG